MLRFTVKGSNQSEFKATSQSPKQTHNLRSNQSEFKEYAHVQFWLEGQGEQEYDQQSYVVKSIHQQMRSIYQQIIRLTYSIFSRVY